MTVEPDGDAAAVATVSRFRLSPVPAETQVGIYEGQLSSYHLGRIRSGDLPETLMERRVPVLTWRTEGDLVVVPTDFLTPGETYSVASESGFLGEVTVRGDDNRPVLSRIWPPVDSSEGGPLAVYCGDYVNLAGTVSVALAPDWVAAVIEPGAAPGVREQQCVRLRAVEGVQDGSWFMPPPTVHEHLLDPTPVEVVKQAAPRPPACATGWAPVGSGCGRVEDDRFSFQSIDRPTFLAMHGLEIEWAEALGASGRAVVRGLNPNSLAALDLSLVTAGGYLWEGRLVVATTGPRCRVVINEVYADALGPEPQQEWIELFNDGIANASLQGWVLEDSGGSVVLGDVELGSGAFALLVRDDFDAQSPVDPAVSETVTVIRLPLLGKNGLNNSGEPLVLRTADGNVSSRFPATPKPKSGISVARRFPWSPDDDAESFGYHALSGASPGATNQVD
jgi:hypothetical protein